MRIKKIIHEELGQELEKLGFHFVPGERIFWPYEREKDGVKQGITIARDRYESGYLKVYFEVSGRQPTEFCDFVQEEGSKRWEFWGYTNEEEGLPSMDKRMCFFEHLNYMCRRCLYGKI